MLPNTICAPEGFQSTPPARGGDIPYLSNDPVCNYFNPRPPRGGRLHAAKHDLRTRGISIHAPREGGDFLRPAAFVQRTDFNPRPPRGGRRMDDLETAFAALFQSTPPARGATIPRVSPGTVLPQYFNPRPPRGGRLPNHDRQYVSRDFNPRPPRGGRPIMRPRQPQKS